MTNICLTFDVDWAPEEVLNYLVHKLTKANIKATFFATHDSDILKSLNSELFEVGIHPNFNNSKGDFVTPIEELMTLYPNSTGGRSHSLFFSSNILETYEKVGLKYESNIFLPYHKNLTLVKRRKNLVSIPFFWSDDYCLANNLIDKKKVSRLLEVEGLKVFNFHPIHIFVNTPSLAYYQTIKQYYHEPEKLLEKKNKSKYGVEDIFNELIDLINNNDIKSNKMEGISKNESL
jgi:hypothetical protein